MNNFLSVFLVSIIGSAPFLANAKDISSLEPLVGTWRSADPSQSEDGIFVNRSGTIIIDEIRNWSGSSCKIRVTAEIDHIGAPTKEETHRLLGSDGKLKASQIIVFTTDRVENLTAGDKKCDGVAKQLNDEAALHTSRFQSLGIVPSFPNSFQEYFFGTVYQRVQ